MVVITRGGRVQNNQPPGAVDIDKSNPITSGLVFHVSDFSGRDLAGNRFVAKTASLQPAVTQMGRGMGSAGTAAFSAPLDLSGTNAITVALIARQDSGAVAQMLAELTANANTTAGSFLAYFDANKLYVGISTGSGAYNVIECPAPAIGRTTKIIFTLERIAFSAAKAARVWYDGIEQATTQTNYAPVGGNFANSAIYFLGRGASSTFFNGAVQDVALWSRKLDDKEILSWSANPWQLIKPLRTRTLISLGGGIIPAVDGSVTGTGALTYSAIGAVYGVLPNSAVVSARDGIVFSGISAVNAEVIPIIKADVAANASNVYSGFASSSITLAPKIDVELKSTGSITYQGIGSVEVNLAALNSVDINTTDAIKYSGYGSVETSTAGSISCSVQSSSGIIYIGNSSVNISTDDSISVTTNGQGSIAYKALGNVDTSTTPVVSLAIDANDSIAYRSTGSIAGVLTTLGEISAASSILYSAMGDIQTTVGQNAVDVISEAQGRLAYTGSAYADVVFPSIISVTSQGSMLYSAVAELDIAAVSTAEVDINSNGAFSYKARSTIYVDKDMTTPDTKYLSIVRVGNYLSTSGINTYVSKA